jgi:hypothetical protein
VTPLSHNEERLDVYHDGEPLWYRTMEDLLGKQPVLGLVPHNLEAELADLPRGHRTITLKWVFKPKRDEAGAIIKHKARLVARGFVQQEGFDFDDAFAPLARMEFVRLLLSLAA